MRAFIGLGSNLGDRLENLRNSIHSLRQRGVRVLSVSSVYETDPVGPPQPDFLNAACMVETDRSPADLVELLKDVEVEVGRVPGDKWEPRAIDLDLLLYGDETFSSETVTVPHPELTKRAFAMIPLLQIDPAAKLPSGVPIAELCEQESPGVRLYGEL